MFNISRLLHTDTGRLLISILIGLGLAALFRGKCVDKKCIEFKGPVIDQVTGKVYRFNDNECSKFKLMPVKRDESKKIVELPSKLKSDELLETDNFVGSSTPAQPIPFDFTKQLSGVQI